MHALQRLINGVLDFATEEAGRVEYDIQPVDVREIVNSVILELEPDLSAKRLDSVADIPPDVRASADPDTLREILRHLLRNAIRYTEPGGLVMVDVGYPVHMPEGVVLLRITDDGRGVARERMDEIFEPADAGHGLAISRELARAMHGDIRVRSEEGEGAVFTLTLPRVL